jgi:hypothetical protein
MAHLRPVVGESELADAFRAIADSGFKASDFSIVDHADPTPADRPYWITGTVTVTRRNGKSKVYKAGTGSEWPAELEIDVKAGFFGRP